MTSAWDDLDHLKRNLERAFEDIYRLYKLPFLRWLQKQWPTLKTEDHLDIFQDTVIQLWLNIQSGRLEVLTASLWTYMCSIGKYLASAYWRKTRRINYFDDMTKQLSEMDPDAENERLTAEMLEGIWQHIDQMEEPNRSILTLTFKYGMSSMEIAVVMNYSTKNDAAVVRVQRARALKELKALLAIQKPASS